MTTFTRSLAGLLSVVALSAIPTSEARAQADRLLEGV